MSNEYFDINTHIVLNKRVVVELPPIEEKTAGGIILPEATMKAEARAKTQAKLVAFGEGAFDELENKPKIGDMIFYNSFVGTTFFDKEENGYRNISHKDVMGYQPSNINK